MTEEDIKRAVEAAVAGIQGNANERASGAKEWAEVEADIALVERLGEYAIALREFVAWVAAEVPDYHTSVKQHERARELLNLADEG